MNDSDNPANEDMNTDVENERFQKAQRLQRHSDWSNWSVLAVIILCFFVVIWFRPIRQQDTRLSELELQPLAGGASPVSLADLTGRVVLINLWGTWCPPCRQELPHMADLQRSFKDHAGFRLLAVSCGRNGNEDLPTLQRNTEELLSQQNIHLPVYADPGGITRAAIANAVGKRGYPTTLLIDRSGNIRHVWTGYRPGLEDEISQYVRQLLQEG